MKRVVSTYACASFTLCLSTFKLCLSRQQLSRQAYLENGDHANSMAYVISTGNV